MSTIVIPTRAEAAAAASAAGSSLRKAAKFWFIVAFIGQWAFLYYLVRFYGTTVMDQHFEIWRRNKFLFKGYVPGDTAGNLTFLSHALFAAVIVFGGALQLVPQIRTRYMAVHRWIGRVFLLTALGESLSGFYLVWVRHATKSVLATMGTTLNGILIVVCVILAWRTARAHDSVSHRKWALRTFLVANGQWFTRVGVFAWVIVSHAHWVREFFHFWDFGAYLLPLAVLELYFYAQKTPDRNLRRAVASGLVVLTLLMAVGIIGVTVFIWKTLLVGL
jgi:hypothetical protein